MKFSCPQRKRSFGSSHVTTRNVTWEDILQQMLSCCGSFIRIERSVLAPARFFFFFHFNNLNGMESQPHVILAFVTNTYSVLPSKIPFGEVEISTGIDWIATANGRTNLVNARSGRQITQGIQS